MYFHIFIGGIDSFKNAKKRLEYSPNVLKHIRFR